MELAFDLFLAEQLAQREIETPHVYRNDENFVELVWGSTGSSLTRTVSAYLTDELVYQVEATIKYLGYTHTPVSLKVVTGNLEQLAWAIGVAAVAIFKYDLTVINDILAQIAAENIFSEAVN